MNELVDNFTRTVLTTPGDLDPEIRRVVAEGGDPPEALRSYVDKVRKHAYKVTDSDVEKLKEAGYSEDAIFEATVAAALGAGLVRLRKGLEVLDGGFGGGAAGPRRANDP